MSTGLALDSISDERHRYPNIFLHVAEYLVSRLLVHEDTFAVKKKEQSAFYVNNMDFMGLSEETSGNSLKQLS